MHCILFLLLVAGTTAQEWHIKPYAQVKSSIPIPTVDHAQRNMILSQISRVLQLYVNRESKIFHYNVDAHVAMQQLIASSSHPNQFHFQLSAMFASFRDLHTQYILPRPYACFDAVYPLKMTLVHSKSGITVATNGFSPHLRGHSSGITQLYKSLGLKRYGDTIVQLNNQTFEELYDQFQDSTGGSNESGGYRSLLRYFSLRYGSFSKLPDDTTVKYLIRQSNGNLVSFTSPIFVRYLPSCISNNHNTEGIGLWASDSTLTNIKTQLNWMATPLPVQPKIDKDPCRFLSYKGEQFLSWCIVHDAEQKAIGIIRLEAFKSSRGTKGSEDMIGMIRNLLESELKETEALIIDLRDNGGGFVPLADGLTQLFTPNPHVSHGRAINHELNRRIFTGPLFARTEWSRSFDQLPSNAKYTKVVPFVPKHLSRFFGMSYMRPTGVLVNGLCYSACEIFTANMQDSGAGIIVGEDQKTGGGGANMVDYNTFIASELPDVFQPLRGVNLRLAWRQVVRKDGSLLEDNGVNVDLLIRPRPNDLPSINYVLKVAKKVMDIQYDRMGLLIKTDLPVMSVLVSQVHMSVTGEVQGLHRLVVSHENSVLGQFDTSDSHRKEFTIGLPRDDKKLDMRKLIIHGYRQSVNRYKDKLRNARRPPNVRYELILETYRYIKLIPEPDHYLKIYPGLEWEWDFVNTRNVGIYHNMDTKIADGWRFDKKSLVVGHPAYAHNVNSQISIFVFITDGMSPLVTIEGEYDTEEKCDQVRLYATHMGTETMLAGWSGVGELEYSKQLRSFEGLTEIIIRFESDELGAGRGVRIHRIAISA